MFLLFWLRSVIGYVKFSGRGVFLEKFISDCVKNKIHIWGISRHEEYIDGFVLARDYKRLRPFAKKNSIKLFLLKKHGVPFFINRYHRRIGIILGCAIFILTLTVLSNFVWTFEVEGNEKVSEEEILSSLEEFGLKVGSYIGAVDVRKLQQQMLLKFDDLAWIGININSSVAEILVHERVFPPQQERNDDGLFNIVASESGQIKRLEVYSGQPVVQVGEAVNAGDLIVSGIVEDPKGNATLRHARAKVLALVPFNEEFVIDLKESFKIDTGRTKSIHTLNLFGLKIPLYFSKEVKFANFYTEDSTIYPSFLGFTLPMKVEKRVFVESQQSSREISLEEAKKRAFEEYSLFKGESEVHNEIISEINYPDKYLLVCEGTILKDIAKEVEVKVE